MGDSVLQRVYEDLRQARGGYAAVATLLQDASQGVFAVKDFYALMAQDDGAKTFEQRMELMDMSRGWRAPSSSTPRQNASSASRPAPSRDCPTSSTASSRWSPRARRSPSRS